MYFFSCTFSRKGHCSIKGGGIYLMVTEVCDGSKKSSYNAGEVVRYKLQPQIQLGAKQHDVLRGILVPVQSR
jgi:hypothetical protein